MVIFKEMPDVIGNLSLEVAAEKAKKAAKHEFVKPVLATFHWSDSYRSGLEKWQDEDCPSALFEPSKFKSIEDDKGVRVPRVYEVYNSANEALDILAVCLWEENQTSVWYFTRIEG